MVRRAAPSAFSIFADGGSHLQRALATRVLLPPSALFFLVVAPRKVAMQITYCPHRGFLLPQPACEDDAAIYLAEHGLSRHDAVRTAATIRRAAEAIDRSNAMREFVSLHCVLGEDGIPFADFFRRFQHFAPKHLQYRWTRAAVTRALPTEHRTVAATGNRKIIPGIAWRTFD
ncbi:hypothetical protein [Lacipirellula parvula]|nr:hypothetical protein [Lacipirellula parvula]